MSGILLAPRSEPTPSNRVVIHIEVNLETLATEIDCSGEGPAGQVQACVRAACTFLLAKARKEFGRQFVDDVIESTEETAERMTEREQEK